MKILSSREEFSFNYLTVELSEGELMLYEGCIDYVLKNCEVEKMYDLVGGEKEELFHCYKQIVKALVENVPKKYLPEKLRGIGNEADES